jgi:hypothetical protein
MHGDGGFPSRHTCLFTLPFPSFFHRHCHLFTLSFPAFYTVIPVFIPCHSRLFTPSFPAFYFVIPAKAGILKPTHVIIGLDPII